jgi:AcrR family transcriptional regulator
MTAGQEVLPQEPVRRRVGRPRRVPKSSSGGAGTDLLPPTEEEGTARRVLEEGVRFFGEHGYSGVAVRDIAEGVGIQPGAIYTHLPSKEALLERIMGIAHDHFEGVVVRAISAAGPGPAEQLSAFVRASVSFHAKYPRLAMVVNHELRALSPEALARTLHQRQDWEAVISRIIDEGNQAGVFECSHPGLTAKAIGGMCIRVAAWIEREEGLDVGEVADHYVARRPAPRDLDG